MDIECTSACKFKSPEILNSLPMLKIKPWDDIDLSFMAEFIPDTQRLQWVIISKNDTNEPGSQMSGASAFPNEIMIERYFNQIIDYIPNSPDVVKLNKFTENDRKIFNKKTELVSKEVSLNILNDILLKNYLTKHAENLINFPQINMYVYHYVNIAKKIYKTCIENLEFNNRKKPYVNELSKMLDKFVRGKLLESNDSDIDVKLLDFCKRISIYLCIVEIPRILMLIIPDKEFMVDYYMYNNYYIEQIKEYPEVYSFGIGWDDIFNKPYWMLKYTKLSQAVKNIPEFLYEFLVVKQQVKKI